MGERNGNEKLVFVLTNETLLSYCLHPLFQTRNRNLFVISII